MSDTPLYLIPGTMCDERLWGRVEALLPDPEIYHADYSSEDTLDDMRDTVLSHAPVGQSHLIGFSLGGYLAMLSALQAPERFKSLTVIASSPYGLSAKERELRQRNVEMLKNVTYRGMSQQRLKQFVSEAAFADESITGTILSMERDLGQAVLMRQLMAPINRPDISADLAALEIPIHFIMADGDQMVPPSTAESLIARADNITLHRVQNSGHMMPLEVPEVLADLLKVTTSEG